MNGKRGYKKIILELLRQDRKFFTLNQIVRETGLDRYDVRDVLIELCIEDYLKRIRKEAQPRQESRTGPNLENVTYRTKRPKTLAIKIAPKLRGQNTACDRMWFIIRKKRAFTRKDLRLLAGVGTETARHYTKMLRRVGIIKERDQGEWRLVKDVGPRRPYVSAA